LILPGALQILSLVCFKRGSLYALAWHSSLQACASAAMRSMRGGQGGREQRTAGVLSSSGLETKALKCLLCVLRDCKIFTYGVYVCMGAHAGTHACVYSVPSCV
jgi:hypothetical protein